MRKIYLSLFSVLSAPVFFAQSFTLSTDLLPSNHNSGGCTGVTDMNNDGLDDIVILDQSESLMIAYQQNDGTFDVSSFGNVSPGESQWGMCVGDVDNDGHKDVMTGGHYDSVHIININGPGDYEQTDYEWAYIYMQGCNLADINNDGWLDGFACHDDGHSAILQNDGTGAMINGAALMDLTFYPEIAGGNDNSGNYGSVWTDFDRDGDTDLFIAKCRQFINDPYDYRRTNILMVNDGNNNYTEQAAERGLVNLQQSWTSDFADMDNDGDFDVLLTTHSNTLEIYANDGAGYFTNVTTGSGLEYSGFYLQAKMADFDNDGFLDLIHAGGTHRYFHNNGNMTWTLMNNTFNFDDTMHSFGVGDLNHDGWLDVYASYGDGYVDADNQNDDQIFLNDGNNNNFIVFDLEGTISNRDAAGAIVEIHGAWGVQIREVRDGESYGITNTSMCHFGIGTATEVDYALIYWPAGGVTVLDHPAINEWHEVMEGECTPPTATISASGDTYICLGESVTLSIDNAGGQYQWSNGATGTSIDVNQTGTYSLIVWNEDTGCGGTSNMIDVFVGEDQIPTITVSGDLNFCEGGSVQLISSGGNGYLWTNGAETGAITVTEDGTYGVTVTGACETLTSETVIVTTFDSPVTPSISDVTINQNTTATLSGPGNELHWYDAVNATEPIYVGNSFTTPTLTSTTSYWVEDVNTYGGEGGFGGKTNNTTSAGQYQTSPNYYLEFDALEDCTIESVKVYASGAGNRTFEIIDNSGNSVATGTFNLVDGESVVDVNFFVPAGEGYGFRCTSSNPQLWRDKDLTVDHPYNYPYNVANLVSITGTNVGNEDTDNYYYFFYDWNVVTPTWQCAGEREEVQVMVNGINELDGVTDMNIYPNPANTVLGISMNSLLNGKMTISLIDQSGRIVQTSQWNTSTGRNVFSMDVNTVAAGIYQLRISMNDKSVSSKVVID